MLTKRQKQVLDYIKKYVDKYDYAPSLEEIKKHLRLSSVSTAHYHVQALQDMGYLRKEVNQPRALDVFDKQKFVQIPLLGRIAAGAPIEAVEDKESIAVPQSKLKPNNKYFALKVVGKSMIEENIDEGDVVLVKQQNVASNGDRVVALLENNEATLKKFYRLKNRIKLESANKSFDPIFVKDIQVQGIVVDVIKGVRVQEDKEKICKDRRSKKEFPVFKYNGITFYNGDCVDVLPSLPSQSVNLIFADPPYNISQIKFGKIKFQMGKNEYLNWTGKWIEECHRILSNNGSIFVMGHPRFMPYIMPILDKKFYFINQIIYHYTDGMPEKKCFAKRYECILFYRKIKDNYIFNLDDVRVEATRYDKYSHPIGKNPGDVWQINRVRWNSKERISLPNGKIAHVSQKPIELLKRIILASSNEGDLVLDPFLGTGTTSVAALELNRKSIGIELIKEYFDVSVKRIKNTVKEKKEFSPEKIFSNIKHIENRYKKIDEWIIPRDRHNFYLTHDFHPYFAAFPPQLAKNLIEKYSDEKDLILDPFVGGGSATVEACLLKRNSIGIDISPLSTLISKVKSLPIKIPTSLIDNILCNIAKDINKQQTSNYKNFTYSIPKITNVDRWFEKTVQFKLSIILNHILSIKNKGLKDFLLVGFSSIIRKASNAKNVEQHLCIKKDKKIPDTYGIFSEKIKLMMNQMSQYHKIIGKNDVITKFHTYDVRNMKDIIKKENVDLIVTSPPYGTGSKYSDIYRLSFGWLQLDKPKKEATLERSKDFKKELKESLRQMYYVLKPGHRCCIVYGDPSTEGLTRKAISDAIDIGFRYEGLISCPLVKLKSKRYTKYRQFIPKDFILIFKKV